MQELDTDTRALVNEILDHATDLTLATVRPDGYPQATTVSFVHIGWLLYTGIGRDSQKARNIARNPKVSLTVDLPYQDWDAIRGLSMGGRAALVRDAAEESAVQDAFLRKFPQIARLIEQTGTQPWENAVFLRVTPEVVSVLDYSKGFGHTDLFELHDVTEPLPALLPREAVRPAQRH
ncbi:MAG: pyridoxamine 5'-phosphate oxidase family protein [Telluria sp.]